MQEDDLKIDVGEADEQETEIDLDLMLNQYKNNQT